MTAIPQIEKTQFQNNFGGWLGVVVIDPKGQDVGVSVAPDGKVWLSENEQRLTANAPRDAKDNPFIEQTHQRRSAETGELEDYTVIPLTVCSDMRYVPSDVRPIPATTPAPLGIQHAQMAATGEESVTVTEMSAPALQREHAMADAPANIKPNEPVVPPRAAAAAAAARESAPEPVVTEETAQESNEGETVPTAPQESVGAATPPSGDAPTGGYASNEEVGTPTTPTPQGDEPAPWQG